MSDEKRRRHASAEQVNGNVGPPRHVHVRDDTIVAVATPPGRGAVAIVRISGPNAESIGRRIVQPWPDAARRMERCTVHEVDRPDQGIDDALVVFFPGTQSYTGEPVVELHVHGGLYGPAAIRDSCVAAGARDAQPGEFTERAFLNGKLDLAQAEAVGSIVDARTRAAHRAALSALSGTLSRLYTGLRDAALGLDALLAYDIDFPEEDDGPVRRETVLERATALHDRLNAVLAAAPAGPIAREGAVVVIAGPPNAGKSSLLNAMVGEARVIVSDEPGTTRDAVEVLMDADPWPLRLVDTAGIRDAPGAVERLGIEISERYVRNATVVLACADDPADVQEAATRISAMTDAELILVRTKADLESGRIRANMAAAAIRVSAHTGMGLAELRTAIEAAVARAAGSGASLPAAAITPRQQRAVEAATRELRQFMDAWNASALPTPVAATHVRAAITALDELIGPVSPDDVLARVFETFCVGK